AGDSRRARRLDAPRMLRDEPLGAWIEDEAERGQLCVRAGERADDRLSPDDEMLLRRVHDGAAPLEPELEVPLAVVDAVYDQRLCALRPDQHDVRALIIRLRLA